MMTPCMYAKTVEVDFSYNEGIPQSVGSRSMETVDVAIKIDDPSLAGLELVGITAYVSPTSGLLDTSVWLSSALQLSARYNDPDIVEIPVDLVEGEYAGRYICGVLEARLETPYVMTEKPVYVGYSMTIASLSSQLLQYPVVITEGHNDNSMFLHGTQTQASWANLSEMLDASACIVAHLRGDFDDYYIDIVSGERVFAEEGESFMTKLQLLDKGAEPVSKISYKYSYDENEEVKTGSFDIEDPLTINLSIPYTLEFPFEGVSGEGSHKLYVTIDEINGEPNSITEPYEVDVIISSFIPVHRPLVEEYTGLWCGWCPRGFYGMEKIAETFGDSQVSICYHNNSQGSDPMTVTTSYPMSVSGFPNASVDRQALVDPWYGSVQSIDFGIGQDVENAIKQPTIADINVTANFEGDNVEIDSEVQFLIDKDYANYQIGYVLVCNGLSNDSWAQTNYFPMYKSDYIGTPLEPLTQWSSRQYGLVFNDVAVDVNGMRGVAGSLPTTIKFMEKYNHHYSYNISGNRLIQNRSNLVVTAFIIDKSTGKIVNANKFSLYEAGVDKTGVEADVISTEYYDLSGRRVVNPEKGIFVRTDRLGNGEIRTRKVVL